MGIRSRALGILECRFWMSGHELAVARCIHVQPWHIEHMVGSRIPHISSDHEGQPRLRINGQDRTFSRRQLAQATSATGAALPVVSISLMRYEIACLRVRVKIPGRRCRSLDIPFRARRTSAQRPGLVKKHLGAHDHDSFMIWSLESCIQ